MATNWHNDDGLYIKFGRNEGTGVTGGEVPGNHAGPNKVAEQVITLTSLGSASTILNDAVLIPAGARIEKVQIITDTLATSDGSATLNVGLIREDRSTTYDADGFVVQAALTTIDAAGETTDYVEGSTAHGALIGTTLAYAGRLVADYDAAAYTAGVIRVRIHYYQAS